MKNRTIKIIVSLLLAILMVIPSVALVGCDKSADAESGETTAETTVLETTDESTDAVSTDTEAEITEETAEETEETEETTDKPEADPEPVIITVLENGKTDFTIVVANSASSNMNSAAASLAEAFKTHLGIDIAVKKEVNYKEDNNDSIEGAKIVFGVLLGDADSSDLEKSLRPNEYAISAGAESIYFAADKDTDWVTAVDKFIETYLVGAPSLLEFRIGEIYKHDLSSRVPVPSLTVAGNDIWRYKIVYYDTYYSEKLAKNVQAAIADSTGYMLELVKDSAAVSDYEILVGKTNRAESREVRDGYDRPNVYYDVTPVGNKLVFMGEGFKTLSKLIYEFNWYMIRNDGEVDINEAIITGNVISAVDTAGVNMFYRTEGTDLRVFHWNLAAPYLNDASKVYTDNKLRGEVMADIILQFMPDIITTNEFYLGHGNGKLYDAVMKELSEYYNILDNSPYEVGKPNANSTAKNQFGKGPTINENILYKKDIGLTVKWSGWRYNYENVYYHGYHTAVFRRSNGQSFIVSVGHYADSRTYTVCAEEHAAAIADAKAASGVADNVPTIITGDMYTWNGNGSGAYAAGYNYWVNAGYKDAQVDAAINGNNNTCHGTFHTIGVYEATRANEDFVWYKNGLDGLCFKVPVSQDIDDTSDHYPVMADLKFS